MFNPFFNPYRVRRIDQGGIPILGRCQKILKRCS